VKAVPYDLTPEAKAFIAAQEPRHITNNARSLARCFDIAEEQIEALQFAVARRKQREGILWRDREVVAMRNRAWARHAAARRAAKNRVSVESVVGFGGHGYLRIAGGVYRYVCR
jgi:hypothetical protein